MASIWGISRFGEWPDCPPGSASGYDRQTSLYTTRPPLYSDSCGGQRRFTLPPSSVDIVEKQEIQQGWRTSAIAMQLAVGLVIVASSCCLLPTSNTRYLLTYLLTYWEILFLFLDFSEHNAQTKASAINTGRATRLFCFLFLLYAITIVNTVLENVSVWCYCSSSCRWHTYSSLVVPCTKKRDFVFNIQSKYVCKERHDCLIFLLYRPLLYDVYVYVIRSPYMSQISDPHALAESSAVTAQGQAVLSQR